MAETIIHDVCLREDQSGQFQFSFKALEGYMFTGSPYIYSINGQEWDTTGGVMTVTFGTDFRERFGDGQGVHGTETVNVILNYDIPSLNPNDDNTNKVSVDFFVKKILTYCLSQNATHYITFAGLGGAPIINGHSPIIGQTSSSYVNRNSAGVYVFAGMATGPYGWYVDSEANACTLYSEQGNINISGTYSKNVFVNTPTYSGNITLYWGTIQINVTGDFDRATMLFENGNRNTMNWFRYRESCQFNLTARRSYSGFSKSIMTRRDDCEIWATNELRRGLLTYNSGSQLVSNTNGYSFSKLYQGRTRYQTTQQDYEIIEPYGRLYRRGNTLISVKSYGSVGYATWQDVSHDNGETWTRIDDTSFSLTQYNEPVARNYWFWSDIVYAGFSEAYNNHIWYALVHYTAYGSELNGYHRLVYSVDDAATFNEAYFEGGDYAHDFEETTQPANYTFNAYRGRLWVDLEKDYIFVFFPRLRKKLTYNSSTDDVWVLYRGFPSKEGVGNGGELRPVLVGNTVSGNPAVYSGIDFTYTQHQKISSYLPSKHVPLSVNDNGLCIFTTQNMYTVSWNFGLNWAVAVDLPTINDTHTNGTSYIYPEYSPTPIYFQGINLVLTSHTDEYSATHDLTRNTIPNSGLLYGAMEVLEKNEEGWVTSNIPESWDDIQTFGVPTGLTSSAIGPYDSNYGTVSIIYGNNILFHNVRYDLNQDPSYGTYYWYSWDIVNQTTTSTGNSAAQTPAGLSPSKMTPYGNKILAMGDINGVVQSVDEDWVLFESTDGGTNFTPIYTHPNNLSYIKSILCEADGTDPFIGVFHRLNPEFTFSFDSGSTWTVLSNPSAFTSYNSSSSFAYTDGYLWIMESRNYSQGYKSWILPANQTVLSDANNWATYEVSQTALPWMTNSVRNFAAYGQKGIIQHGDFHFYTTTDRGQTWTQMTSLTTTDNVTYTSSDFQTWGGLEVSPHTGEFLITVGNYGGFLLTSDFVTWEPVAYDPSDVDGDNNSNFSIIEVNPAPNGNWYALIRDTYTVKPRLYNLSESRVTAPPTIDRLIESWDLIKEYTVTDTNSATNSDYLADGYYGAPMLNITKDYEFPDGIPRLLITRPWAAEVIPPPPAPVITDGSLVEEITYPPFPPSEDLVFDVPAGYMRIQHIYSDKPFGIMFVDKNSRLHKMDGIFNIVSCSMCEPIIVKSSSDQIVNYGDSEELLASGYIGAGSSSFLPTLEYTWNMGGSGFIYSIVYPGNPTRQEYSSPFSLLHQPGTTGLSLHRNRSDVPGRDNKKNVQQLTSYETDYEVQIPVSYLYSGIQTITLPPNYGQHVIWFPPLDRPYINVIGMKIYADPYGTPYVDGYYTTDDIIGTLGWWNTTGGGDGPWENIEETDYMLVKNGIVVEVGNSKNLPDYDQC